MNFKRMTAIILAVMILSSVFVFPAWANTNEGSELLSVEKFKRYIINDQFDTDGDTSGWSKGSVKSGTASFTVSQGTAPDGSGALILSSTGGSSGAAGQQPNAYKALPEKVQFNAENKIVIKTRFMQKGTGASTPSGGGYLKFNQPNDIAFATTDDMRWNWTNTWHRTDAFPSLTGYNTLCRWFELLEFDTTKLGYMATGDQNQWKCTTYASGSTLNKWIEAEITIYGDENITISASVDGVQGQVVNATLAQAFSGPRAAYTLYNDTTATEWINAFTSLDSLTWETTTKNDIYIDYVEIYQETDYVNVTAQVTSGTTNIRANDPVEITFVSDTPIPSLPEDAFEVVGVDTEFSYDAENKKVSLAMNTPLEAGGIYTLNIDGEKIKEVAGLILNGETSYTLEVCNISVSNLVPVGKVIPGNVVTATYQYVSPVAEGTHSYQWKMCDTPNGTFTPITGATEKDFTVTEAQLGKYLSFEMIPSDINGLQGYLTESSVLVPEKAPVVSNVSLSTDTLFEGIYIAADYDFADENGDAEGETEINWFAADSQDSTSWEYRHTGKTYLIGSEDNGKYIKCEVKPVSISEIEQDGAIESAIGGPVVDIIATTNMFTDAGFESGSLESPWIVSNNYSGADLQSKDTHSGNYALHMAPRGALNDHFGQQLRFYTDKIYVFGAWAKKSRTRAQDIKGMTVFAGGDTLQVSQGAPTYTLNDRWQLMSFAYSFKANCTPNSGFVTWTDIDTADVYLDDFYCGELLVADIETYDIGTITIPQSGETIVNVTSGKVLNQLGSVYGLQNETVVVSVPETEGVYVKDNKIVVTEQAYPSKLVVQIYCVPQYSGATQTIFQKFVEIDLEAHDDNRPKAFNVTATGVVAENSVLNASYEFYQIEGKSDASEYAWMYSDSENGMYSPIPNATSTTYTVESAYANKYIKFVVVPKTNDGITGKEVSSNALTGPKKPEATNVKITGDVAYNTTVTGEYVYTDPNYDEEGTSTYRWLIADAENGTYSPIQGQTDKTLVLTEAMRDKYIKFEVTPVSSQAPYTGTPVLSKALLGPTVPKASNVRIQQEGYRLKGMYTYNHPHYIPEKNSSYQWIVDGAVVSTTADYLINFTGQKTVTFCVTPACEDEPAKGQMVVAAFTATGYAQAPAGGTGGSGGSGGSSGGSGGSGTGAGITNINNMEIPKTETQEPEKVEPKNDISGHWGESYIKNMADRGVMTADEKGNFAPDVNVSRESMITFLFKALGLETSEYKNEFEDVSDGEFGKMLQTMVDNGTIAKDVNFRPNDIISREEMCKILYVSLKNANKLKDTDEMKITSFADYENISEWARVYVNAIYSNGIMVGVSDTEFDAKGTVTKAQAATMLTRILTLTEEAE